MSYDFNQSYVCIGFMLFHDISYKYKYPFVGLNIVFTGPFSLATKYLTTMDTTMP